MHYQFGHFYIPDEEFFKLLWDNALIVLDANIFLNLYRYDDSTRTEFLGILNKLKEKLWVPYQVAYEYQNNRINEILNQQEKYASLKKILNDSEKELIKSVTGFSKKYPHFDTTEILEKLKSSYKDSLADIDRLESQSPDLLENDTIRDSITQLLENRVGFKYSHERERQIIAIAEKRYALDIPPGFEDYKKKSGKRKYGDCILWSQILDKAKEIKKSIIFITDEKKEDWWWNYKNRTIGPRPELIEEANEWAKVSFHMYNSSMFIKLASEYINQKISPETLQEVENIQKERETRLREYFIPISQKDLEWYNDLSKSILSESLKFSSELSRFLSSKEFANWRESIIKNSPEDLTRLKEFNITISPEDHSKFKVLKKPFLKQENSDEPDIEEK